MPFFTSDSMVGRRLKNFFSRALIFVCRSATLTVRSSILPSLFFTAK